MVANLCFVETLVSILVHFGNLSFHKGVATPLKEGVRRGCGGGATSYVGGFATLGCKFVLFGNLGFHFSSFWKPWFPFYFILETLVSILDHFGNLGFHFGSFWKPWFP